MVSDTSHHRISQAHDVVATHALRLRLTNRRHRPVLVAFWDCVRAVGLVLEAMILLALFDVLSRRGFRKVYAFTRSRPTSRRRSCVNGTDRVREAVRDACVWYVHRVYCLQRSSVMTWMLRRRGVPAELVIAYRPVPIESHAWVEVSGVIVNDRPEYQLFFRVMDRF